MSSTLPTPNIPALRKTYEWVLRQSELIWVERLRSDEDAIWDQASWRARWTPEALRMLGVRDARDCKTGLCFAGHVADTAGVQWGIGNTSDDIMVTPEIREMIPDYPWQDVCDCRACANTISVAAFAQHYLGLTIDEATDLFSGGNTVEEIRRVLKKIFARAGEEL